MPTRATGACAASTRRTAALFPSAQDLHLSRVCCRSERARIAGSRHWRRRSCAGTLAAAHSALAGLRVPAGRHACSHARAGLWKRPSNPRVRVCATSCQVSCSHEQLTSGKMLGTLRIRWFGLLRAPRSQLVSWGTWQTGCSHQQCWRHISGIKSISLCKKYIKI